MRRSGMGRWMRGQHLRTSARAWIAAVASALAVVAAAAPALATPSAAEDDGLWYLHDTGIAELHEEGFIGEGVTIAIIDSPINLDVPDLAGANIQPRTEQLCPGFTGVETTERAHHSTAMASLLVGNGAGMGDEPGVLGVAPDATVLHYSVLNVAVSECAAPLADFVADAIEQGADILNLSISYNSPRDAQNAIDLALEAGLIVNVAVQNRTSDHLDLLSSLPGVVSIENVERDGQPDAYSVTGPELDFVAPGVNIRMLTTDFSGYELDDGTSHATAWVSGVFALAQSAWPDATGNQLIQAAIRSAGSGAEIGAGAAPGSGSDSDSDSGSISDAPQRTNSEGYGLLDPRTFIGTDATKFPDENPLLVSDAAGNNDAAGNKDAAGNDDAAGDESSPVTSAPEPNSTAVPNVIWVAVAFGIATVGYVILLLIGRLRRPDRKQ